jgi:uncharacterized phage-associated protein
VEVNTAIDKRPATNANTVADYLVWFGQQHGDPLTNLKLQKLLYYAQGHYMAKRRKVLFGEPLQAWIRGPVVYEVWSKYKNCRWEPITGPQTKPRISPEVEGALGDVIVQYWQFSAYNLERMTHQESPWIKARDGVAKDTRSSAPIAVDWIYDHFVKIPHHGREKTASQGAKG